MRNTLKQTGRMSTASSYAAGSSFVVSREAPVKRIVGLVGNWSYRLESPLLDSKQPAAGIDCQTAVAGKGTGVC
jgi:hypothetical protein